MIKIYSIDDSPPQFRRSSVKLLRFILDVDITGVLGHPESSWTCMTLWNLQLLCSHPLFHLYLCSTIAAWCPPISCSPLAENQ